MSHKTSDQWYPRMYEHDTKGDTWIKKKAKHVTELRVPNPYEELNWQSAFKRLQLGGERGYGWGSVELIEISQFFDKHLFDGLAVFRGDGNRPIIHLPAHEHLLAHTQATDLPAAGKVEPLVGREWRSDNSRRRHAGQHVEFGYICFDPGSIVYKDLDFIVKEFGVWVAQ